MKRQIKRTRQRVGERRFPDARNVFDQQMTFGEQCDEREFDGFRFAFDDALNLILQKADLFNRIKFNRRGFSSRLGFVADPISNLFISAVKKVPDLFYRISMTFCTKISDFHLSDSIYRQRFLSGALQS